MRLLALALLLTSPSAFAAGKSFVRSEGSVFDGRSLPDKRQGSLLAHLFPSESGKLTAGASWLSANGHDEQSAGLGYLFDLGSRHSLRLAASGGFSAVQFPTISAELEFVAPLGRALLWNLTSRVANYERARVLNALFGTGVDWYAGASSVLLGRIYYSYDTFRSLSRTSDAFNFMVKYLHLFEDMAKAWAYFANSTDSFARDSAGDIGTYQGRTYGAGLGGHLGRDWWIDGNFELQRRNHTDLGYSVYSLALTKEW